MSKNLISFQFLRTFAFLIPVKCHFEASVRAAQSGEHNGGLRASISCCCG